MSVKKISNFYINYKFCSEMACRKKKAIQIQFNSTIQIKHTLDLINVTVKWNNYIQNHKSQIWSVVFIFANNSIH